MDNRKATIIASVVALALIVIAQVMIWRDEGKPNPALFLFIPIILIGLLAALRKKT